MLKVAGAILLVALAVGVAYIGTRPTELEKFDACMQQRGWQPDRYAYAWGDDVAFCQEEAGWND